VKLSYTQSTGHALFSSVPQAVVNTSVLVELSDMMLGI
jgi:hypothetical protein